jgi:hypothetical protein
MSYSLTTPCYCCKKNDKCTDGKLLQDAVNKIHSNSFEQGHQGGGTVAVTCVRANSNQA